MIVIAVDGNGGGDNDTVVGVDGNEGGDDDTIITKPSGVPRGPSHLQFP